VASAELVGGEPSASSLIANARPAGALPSARDWARGGWRRLEEKRSNFLRNSEAIAHGYYVALSPERETGAPQRTLFRTGCTDIGNAGAGSPIFKASYWLKLTGPVACYRTRGRDAIVYAH
jgi:hypothetical protein